MNNGIDNVNYASNIHVLHVACSMAAKWTVRAPEFSLGASIYAIFVVNFDGTADVFVICGEFDASLSRVVEGILQIQVATGN